jgi:cell division protein FtsI (penicillin-binding protein 3)
VNNKPVNIKKVILVRTYIAFAVLLVFAGFIVAYLFKIQYTEGDKWRIMSEELTTRIETTEPMRGNVYSVDGSLLATSIPYFDLRVDGKAQAFTKSEIFDNKVDSLAYMLSKEFKDKSATEYKQLLYQIKRSNNRFFLLKRRVSYMQMKRVRNFPIFNEGRFKGGLTVVENNRREKPFKMLAERTIGYYVKGQRPVGIEGAFNEYLSGKQGKRVVQRVAGGAWIPISDDEQIEAQNGMDIITSIDVNLQDVAQSALLKTLVKNNAEWGTAILMEVQTGEIRAIANLKRKSEGIYIEELNYALRESCEPGSTFKLFSVMALLDEGLAKPDDLYDTEGGKKQFFTNATMYDSEEGGHGIVTLHHAFEVSSNVAISKAVYENFKKHPERYYNYYQKLKLTEPLGLQLTGEGIPRIKHPNDKDWSGTTLPWSSIGYEVNVTPLQIITVYNAVANEGKMMKPLFVKSIERAGLSVVKFEPEVLNKSICKPSTLKQVQAMLRGVVENGTGRSLRNPHYSVAGKTGTALVADGKAGYKKPIYRSSFIGYFPADEPKYTCFVMVNGPSKGIYYGAAVAGPVFKEIADKVFASSVRLHPDIRSVYDQQSTDLPLIKRGYNQQLHTIAANLGLSIHSEDGKSYKSSEWIGLQNAGSFLKSEPKVPRENLIPDVVGMGARDAIYLLENMGLEVMIKGVGKVIFQSIMPGENIYKGTTIQLKLG